MLVPVVRSLARQYPHTQITVLSKPFARFFFDGLERNISFMGADIDGEYKSIHGLNVLYRRLTAKQFTAIADFHDTFKTHYLRTRFTLGMYKTAHINRHRNSRRRLTAQKNKCLSPLPTTFELYSEVLEKLGYPVKIEFDTVFGKGKGNIKIISDRIQPKLPGERWIGIAPFAGFRSKVYPKDRMLQTVNLLLERDLSCRLFFFGSGKKEHDQIASLIGDNPRCIDASLTLSNLGEELVLMSHLDVMLSMDSANMHFASLTGTRVVSVWGSTHPYAGFLGWGQSIQDTVGLDLPCRPCSIYGSKKCHLGNNRCMQINPEIIVNKLLQN